MNDYTASDVAVDLEQADDLDAQLMHDYARSLADLELRAALTAADRAPRDLDAIGLEQAWHELDEWARETRCDTTDPAWPNLTHDSLDRARKALRHNGSRDPKTVAAQRVTTPFFSRTPADPSGRPPALPRGWFRDEWTAAKPVAPQGFSGPGTRCAPTVFGPNRAGTVEDRRCV